MIAGVDKLFDFKRRPARLHAGFPTAVHGLTRNGHIHPTKRPKMKSHPR